MPDSQPRASFIDELDGAVIGDYHAPAAASLQFSRPGIDKSFALDGNRLTVTWQLHGLAGRRFTTVVNLAMPSCDGFLGRYRLADGTIPCGFGDTLALGATGVLHLDDGVLGGSVTLTLPVLAEISGRPQQTVSQSEAGFEKIMQAVALRLNWAIPADHYTLQIHLNIETQNP